MVLSFDVHSLGTVASTQDEALKLFHQGRGPGTVVMAEAQTKGRGRHGNAWVSMAGNLYASVVLDLKSSEAAGNYSFMVGLALYQALASWLKDSSTLKLKWPNDILMDGRKISGVLLEQPVPGCLIAGLGVNIAHAPTDRACLNDVAAEDVVVTPRIVLDRFLEQLNKTIALYQAQGIAPVLAEWKQNAAGLGGVIHVRLPDEVFEGRFIDLAPSGALIVDVAEGGQRTIHAGEVFFRAEESV